MKNTKKGFTLVELLVVIAILAILSTVAVVGYTSFIAKADQAKADAELKQIITLVNAEYAEEGKVTLEDLNEFLDDNQPEGSDVEATADENGVITITYKTKDDKATATGTILIKLAEDASEEPEEPAEPENP